MGLSELAPADLSQYFQALNFADGGTWNTGSAHHPPPSSLHQGVWHMSAWRLMEATNLPLWLLG